MDNFLIFLLGVIVGLFIGVFVCQSLLEHDKDKCQKAHNVYECEMKYVPVERE